MWITRATVMVATFTLLVGARPARAVDCRHLPAPDQPRAVPNDNRVAGGTIRDGVVALRLVIREASWYPDGPDGCALRVRAFWRDLCFVALRRTNSVPRPPTARRDRRRALSSIRR